MVRIDFLEEEEGLLLFTFFRDQALAVESVLESGDVAAGRTEVHQDPGSGSAQLRNVIEHDKLVLQYVHLLLFAPAVVRSAVVAEFGFGAEFGKQDWFFRKNPSGCVSVLWVAAVPADVELWSR